jgi:hypothetical protein
MPLLLTAQQITSLRRIEERRREQVGGKSRGVKHPTESPSILKLILRLEISRGKSLARKLRKPVRSSCCPEDRPKRVAILRGTEGLGIDVVFPE